MSYTLISPFSMVIDDVSTPVDAAKWLVKKKYFNKAITKFIIQDPSYNRYGGEITFYNNGRNKSRITLSQIKPVKVVSPISPVVMKPVLVSPVVMKPALVSPVVMKPVLVSRVIPISTVRTGSPLYGITGSRVGVTGYYGPNGQLLPVLQGNNINSPVNVLFNTQEISNLMFSLDVNYFKQYIEPKLLNRKSTLQINHNINTDNYNDIYFTSDLHADYRKLVQMLVNAKLISIPTDINIYSDQIYDPRIISESQWIKSNSLFIVIGDLIDGHRSVDVDDRYGSFELLLHLLLYNLKIKAQQINSDVLFTIGNHDLHSVLAYVNEPSVGNYLGDYVHNTSKKYFINHQTRVAILKLFYDLSPYLFLNLNNNEIICVHGGLHNPRDTEEINMDAVISIQNNININGLSQLSHTYFINNSLKQISSKDNVGRISNGILWTRFYASSNDRNLVCSTIKKTNYKFIVVGHCPTSNFRPLEDIMNNDAKYNNCDRLNQTNGKGCVIIDSCKDENNIPVLAFVDSALSSAFRSSPGINQKRNIELLHLRNNNLNIIPNRKYNIISRLEVGDSIQPNDIQIYP